MCEKARLQVRKNAFDVDAILIFITTRSHAMLISKTHSVSTDPTGTIARQAADKKQLTTQEIKTLAPQIGDTLIEANGKEITLTADNFAAVTAANTKDFFVSK